MKKVCVVTHDLFYVTCSMHARRQRHSYTIKPYFNIEVTMYIKNHLNRVVAEGRPG